MIAAVAKVQGSVCARNRMKDVVRFAANGGPGESFCSETACSVVRLVEAAVDKLENAQLTATLARGPSMPRVTKL